MGKHQTSSRKLAPEDVRKGDYIAVTDMILELPALTCDGNWRDDGKLARFSFMAWTSGQPMKVVGVCLPFVLVRHADGRHDTVDLRRWTVARLSKRFGKAALKRMSPTDCAQTKSKADRKKRKRD
jgi:hypothetical protein